MMHKIHQLIVKKLADLSDDKKATLIENVMIILFDTRENAEHFFKQTISKAETPEEQNKILSEYLNTGFFNRIFGVLNSNSISGLIYNANELENSKDTVSNSITNIESLQNLESKSSSIGQLFFTTIFNITDASNANESIMKLINKEIYYTKEEIATEFGVDKKTFNKWLKIVSHDKFYGRKKLYLLEYFEIFNLLFCANNEKKLDISNNIKLYSERLQKMAVSKNQLTELTSSDYKTLKPNAEKVVPYYKDLNIFPYSIADAIITKMNGKETN